MKWKEVYEKCNNKKYCIITNVKQPLVIKSTLSNFLDKYKWVLLIGTIAIIAAIIATFNFNIKIVFGFLVITLFLLISLTYYNTFKLEIKDNKLILNIMMREITLKKEDLLNIYMEKEKSRIFLIIPFYYYSINILYNNNEKISGYSLSTIMLRKKEVLNFFKHIEFKVLKQQKEEDKKEQIYANIIRLFTLLAIIIVFIAFLVFAIFSH